MKKLMVVFVLLALAAVGFAQMGTPTSDVLGAHLNYGRGCAACHAPHSGAYGNGAAKSAQTTANSYLWGQDTTSLLGQTITVSGSTIEALPASLAAGTPDVSGVLMCLSCHDGNLAQGAMMKNQIYETVNSNYGTYNKIPTLMGNEGSLGAGNYTANHPVGMNASIGCGAPWNWDCSITNGVISMTGTNSGAFVTNYGFFVSPSVNGSKAVVMCTTCHNQHIMNVVTVSSTTKSGLGAGYYKTMFFLVGPYNPLTTTAGSNQTAQFCRQCHGGEANESNGGLNIPTTF
jgi:hypothetical protein